MGRFGSLWPDSARRLGTTAVCAKPTSGTKQRATAPGRIRPADDLSKLLSHKAHYGFSFAASVWRADRRSAARVTRRSPPRAAA